MMSSMCTSNSPLSTCHGATTSPRGSVLLGTTKRIISIIAAITCLAAPIMQKLRNYVSGTRVRYQDGGFDLDLTYITDRCVARASVRELALFDGAAGSSPWACPRTVWRLLFVILQKRCLVSSAAGSARISCASQL